MVRVTSALTFVLVTLVAPSAFAGKCLTKQEFVEEYLSMFDKSDLGNADSIEVDLNGDGTKEVILQHIACGSEGCLALVIEACPDNEMFRVLLEGDGFEVTVLPTKTQGYQDLSLNSFESGEDTDKTEFLSFYSFDGSEYVITKTMQETR